LHPSVSGWNKQYSIYPTPFKQAMHFTYEFVQQSFRTEEVGAVICEPGHPIVSGLYKQ
jgi:hypothetical protein